MLHNQFDPDFLSIDLDGDGISDQFVLATDHDSDGVDDHFDLAFAIDVDDDGSTDVWATEIDHTTVFGKNTDHDSIPDDWKTLSDTNDINIGSTPESSLEISLPELSDVIPPLANTNIADDAEHWHQQGDRNSCAIATQEFILDELGEQYGIEFNEDQLAQEAIASGWYTPDHGTPLDCVGNILEAHGIGVEKQFEGNLNEINQQLQQGHKVLVALDSDEILNPDAANDDLLVNFYGMPGQDANHAVQVIGIDNSDSKHLMVILNDPGRADGMGLKVPAANFLNAWEDSNNFMVSTTGQPATQNPVEYAAVDSNLDHINIGSIEEGKSKAWESHQYSLREEAHNREAEQYAKDGNTEKTLEQMKLAAEEGERADKLADKSKEEFKKS